MSISIMVIYRHDSHISKGSVTTFTCIGFFFILKLRSTFPDALDQVFVLNCFQATDIITGNPSIHQSFMLVVTVDPIHINWKAKEEF